MIRPCRRFPLALLPAMILFAAPPAFAQPPQAGDYSKTEHSVSESLGVKVPMRDGVHLVVDIFRPAGAGKYPAVLVQTPYNRLVFRRRAEWFAQRGYVVVNVDSRGRFDSEGDWDPFSALHKTDGYDLVEWIAKQPWCTGRVGTYGASYMGWTQWWTASQAPPSLKCIVPEVAPPDHFFNAPYQHGVLVSWAVDWAGAMSGRRPNPAAKGAYGGFAATRAADYKLLPYIELDDRRKHGDTKWFDTWINQNTAAGSYWKAIAYQTPADYARVRAPSLAVTGWFDANYPGTPLNYLGMKQHGATPELQRPRLVIGPWEHGFNKKLNVEGIDFGPQAVIDWDGYVCRWFDYHLKQRDNGVVNDPPVHVFVTGRNEWRAASDWPLPETQWTKYYLHGGGKANGSAGDGTLSTVAPQDEPADHYTYDPETPTPSPAFTNGHIDGPRDVRDSAKRADVLVYTTPPLEDDVEVVGPITARLFAATSARDTDWMVRLIDVYPDGRAMFLCDGVMRARHRDPQRDGAFNAERLSTLEPGTVYPYTIEFWRGVGNVFAKGHRIRVEISSSYYPYYLRNLNTGADNIGLETKTVAAQQTVHHDRDRPSHVVLPIIPRGN